MREKIKDKSRLEHINANIVWKLIENELHSLREKIKNILEQEFKNEDIV